MAGDAHDLTKKMLSLQTIDGFLPLHIHNVRCRLKLDKPPRVHAERLREGGNDKFCIGNGEAAKTGGGGGASGMGGVSPAVMGGARNASLAADHHLSRPASAQYEVLQGMQPAWSMMSLAPKPPG